MKKQIILLLTLLVVSTISRAQWTTSGSNTYLTSGNLGLGITDPITKIHVGDNEFLTFGSVFSYANSPTGIQFLGFRDLVSPFLGASIEAEPNWVCCGGYPSSGGYPGVRLMDLNFKMKDANFATGMSKFTAMTIKSATGYVGIGTTTPVDRLDIAGGLHLGNTTLNNPGTIRYTGTDFEGYIGGQWKSLINNNGPVQWAGPTSGVLSTSSTVSITKALSVGMPGTVFPPIFEANSNNGTTTTSVFKVDHNRIDANANLLISNGGLFIIRGGSVPGNALSASTAGVLTLNTNGVSSPAIGFFINSNNRNFFTVTEQQILYKNATQDLFKVDDNGYVYARKSIVTLANPFPDYVFESNYKLKPLNELDAYINKYKHLPNIPSAEEIAANKNQIDVGDMQVKLLEKVEELHLYVLQQQKQIEKQQKEIETLKAKLAE